MKRAWLIGAALLLGTAVVGGRGTQQVARAEEVAPACKAACLMDVGSGVQIFARQEHERLPIASMCKIMTLLLALEAEEAGELSFEEEIVVSERAAGMGGSQVFLGAGLSYRADELLKSIAVCSANDSCVAIAERIAGSEGAFCERMNERAGELGAENTLFANCTGLPKQTQYSCAYDVALMLRALIGHEKYHEYAKIRLEDFVHPDGRTTQMTNTNKLMRRYDGCEGGKTGFTNEAGFCLAASAERGEMRVISVLIGAESSEARFAGVEQMFDYAFDNFESKTFLTAGEALEEGRAVRGAREEVQMAPQETLAVLRRRGTKEAFSLDLQFGALRAPVAAGDVVGHAVLLREGVEIGRTALLAVKDVARLSWWEAWREGAGTWNIP